MTRQQKIKQILEELGEPSYRLKQINQAIYKQKIVNYLDITSLSKPLRERLNAELGPVLTLNTSTTVVGQDVEKVLFETSDKNKIESVWMNYNPEFSLAHESVCVSSQSGCALNCAFCFTGTMGFKKNLEVDEITDQVLYFMQTRNFNGSVSFMGMGEPFSNAANVFEALDVLSNPEMFGIGQRKLNVSTVGVIPGIERLTTEFPQVNLAYSLHTPFEEQRLELMPITKAYPTSDVLNALDNHILATRRKVFLAYIFLGGVNDSEDHALGLAALINARRKDVRYLYHVNLIRYHGENSGGTFNSSTKEQIKTFTKILTEKGIQHTIRQSFGLDIEAACGQLCVKS